MDRQPIHGPAARVGRTRTKGWSLIRPDRGPIPRGSAADRGSDLEAPPQLRTPNPYPFFSFFECHWAPPARFIFFPFAGARDPWHTTRLSLPVSYPPASAVTATRTHAPCPRRLSADLCRPEVQNSCSRLEKNRASAPQRAPFGLNGCSLCLVRLISAR